MALFSPNDHPGALQLEVDLQSLTDIEPGREFIQAWQGNMSKLVMDEECRTLLCDIDFGELRMRALSDAECSVWQSAQLLDHADRETDCSFKCSFTPESGTRCELSSTTSRGLISHMVKAHGFYDPVQRAVITNECPGVVQFFSTRLDAQHHPCSSFLHRFFFCAGGSHVQTEVKQPLLPVVSAV